MAQIDFVQLTHEWKPFAEIVGTVKENTVYSIFNRGADSCVALCANSLPAADNQAGDLIVPNDIGVFIKGSQNLYLRAFNKNCAINVTEGE